MAEEGRPPDNIDLNKNGQKIKLPKILCIKRPTSLPIRKNINLLNGNLINDNHHGTNDNEEGGDICPSSTTNTTITTTSKNRNSFHQDVEEALNSLLWQPYEYQNKQQKRNSTLSSSSSSSSYTISNKSIGDSGGDVGDGGNCGDDDDDDDGGNKGEGTGNSSNNSNANTNSGSSLESLDLDDSPNKDPLHSQNTDLNGTEMVNNLKPIYQLKPSKYSRDQLSSCNTTSRLNSQVSLFLECSANGTNITQSDCSDVYKKSDMQLEVPPSNQTQDGLITINNHNDDNLSSANIVGLPRRSSVPSVQTRNGTVFPNHPRNASEPSMSFLPTNFTTTTPTSSNNNNNNNSVFSLQNSILPTVVPPHNLVSHLRSASVPKTNTNNTTNVNVNFYRAVPVNVVSVPTIQCLNTLNNDGNNVSNVQIMPLSSYQTTTNTNQITVTPQIRTFTSTEAQTDEITVISPPPPPSQQQPQQSQHNHHHHQQLQQQRKKERRRHQRRHRHVETSTSTSNTNSLIQSTNNENHNNNSNNRLPDLLNSHLPPPYTPLPNSTSAPPPPPPNIPIMVTSHGTVLPTVVPPPPISANNVISGLVPFPPPQVPLVPQGAGAAVAPPTPVAVQVQPPSGFRFPFPATGFRRGRFSEEPHPKGCCGLLSWKPGSLRLFIGVVALVAVCCVLVGTALGAMRPAGRDHLTVSLFMIGVGIVLVTLSGIAWRVTSHNSSTCRSMLGLGSTESVDVCTRRFVPRLPPSYGRPHHPYAAMMYPEFQYRPPPPSYQASMQEYRLRLLLLDRGNTPQIQAGIQNAVSPPPTYRSHAGSLLRAPLSSRRDTAHSEYSCPPSYRSQTSTNRPNNNNNHSQSILHSREQSLSLSESNNGESMVNVVNILGNPDDDIALDNITLDSLKMEPDNDINALRLLLKGSNNGDIVDNTHNNNNHQCKEGNLVTIVQTHDQNPVIVTVSGSSQIEGGNLANLSSNEMEILAHL